MLKKATQEWQRKLTVAPRENQTQEEITALRANTERVGFIINARWILVAILVCYSIVGFAIHLTKNNLPTLLEYMIIPANAVLFVCIYNFIFMRYKDELAHISIANRLQLLLDTAVVGVLVYFSGGIDSWFWVIFLLFIFEAATIAGRKLHVWTITLFAIFLLTIIEWGNYSGLLPYQDIPIYSTSAWSQFEFVLLRYLWQITVLSAATLVASALLFKLQTGLADSRNKAILDELTGLYSRPYFQRALEIEASRAGFYGHRIFVGLIDLDNFSEINKRFGIAAGDALIVEIAKSISTEMEKFSQTENSANILARYSGEEFAVILIENPHSPDLQPSFEDAKLLMRVITKAVTETVYRDITVTASIGIAGLPTDASDGETLFEYADEALAEAIRRGGNIVVAFSDCSKSLVETLEYSTAPLENISRYLDE